MLKIHTPVFRVAFPQMFEAKAAPGSEKKKYGLTMLFTLAELAKNPVEKKLFDEMKKAAQYAVEEKWPDVKKRPKNLMNPFRDGAEKTEYQGYGPGVVFVTATRSEKSGKPGLIDARKLKIEDPTDFYGGCYAHATVNPYAWEFMGKAGVSFGLQNVQKVKEGEPFGGKSKAEDDFDARDTELAEETPTTDLFN